MLLGWHNRWEYANDYGANQYLAYFFFSSSRLHTRWTGDWSSDVCSSDLTRSSPPDRPGIRSPRPTAPGGKAHHWPPDPVSGASSWRPGRALRGIEEHRLPRRPSWAAPAVVSQP